MNTYLTTIVYMMVQGVLFGIGTLAILLTPLAHAAELSFPVMIAATMLLSVTLSWMIARLIRLSNRRVNHLAHHKA